MVRKQAARILDLLQEYGADFMAWADDKENSGSTNRHLYLGDYKSGDENHTDNLNDLQVFLRDYIRSRNLQI
jgi:hypothetical protein